MNSFHMQTIHSDAIRADHMARAERRRQVPARAPRTSARDRIRAAAIAIRRPELVATTPRATAAPRGC